MSNFFILLYIYLFKFLIALGPCCYAGFSLAAASGGLLFTVMRRLLTVVASLVEHWALRLTGSVVAAHGPSTCGSRALERSLGSCSSWG